jgi:hypothetical protein
MKTGEPVGEEKMLQRLSEAEKTGMIEGGIANAQDEPTQVWKSRLKPSRVLAILGTAGSSIRRVLARATKRVR